MTQALAVDFLQVLERDPRYRALCQRILEYEDQHQGDPFFDTGWDLRDLGGVEGRVLAQLSYLGVLQVVGTRSRGPNDYLLQDREALREALGQEMALPPPALVEAIPEDLFQVVVGLEPVKRTLRLAVEAERPVHVLLKGGPASAKSTLLMELARLPGARFVLAGTMTKAGLLDYLLEEAPRYLILDELEKGKGGDLSTLLTVMEKGLATRLQHGRREQERRVVTVFAACNRVGRLPEELISRFTIEELQPYRPEELVAVIEAILVRHEGCDPEFALEVAQLVAPKTSDPRRARDIARLSKGDRRLARELAARL